MEELRRVRELAGLVRAKTEHIDRLTEVSRRLRTARFGDSVSDGPQYGFAEVLAELDEIRRELCLYLASYAEARRDGKPQTCRGLVSPVHPGRDLGAGGRGDGRYAAVGLLEVYAN